MLQQSHDKIDARSLVSRWIERRKTDELLRQRHSVVPLGSGLAYLLKIEICAHLLSLIRKNPNLSIEIVCPGSTSVVDVASSITIGPSATKSGGRNARS